MSMYKFFLFAIIALMVSSCTHRIKRTGYKKSEVATVNCNAIIQKFYQVPDSVALKVGEIKLGETGFSTQCNEEQAIKILKREACSLNADLINITEETRPNVTSTCYRCKAEFYKYIKPVPQPASNVIYSDANVQQRVKSDRKKNWDMIIGAAIAGAIAGLVSSLF